MKTKIHKEDVIKVITLGCSKNTVDSEFLMGHIKAADKKVSTDSQNDDSNIIIINTCGFIQESKQESIDEIIRYVNKKKEGKIDQLFVIGCLAERYKNELKKEIPEVNQYFGVHDYKLLLNTLNIDYKKELSGQRLLTTPKHYAYLKISEGCDRTCSFCAIPLIRGKHISKPKQDLIKEACFLSRQGVKELLIIAQDSTYYGIDLYKKSKLAELLKKLSEIEEIEWIKIHYAYPAQFPEDVIDLMAENSRLCKYLDIPFQHINDRILKSMKRSHTKKDTIRLINLSRNKIKDLAIRTTLIVGYPGESDKEFSELYDFVKEMKFERLGVFKYSHEEGTTAYKLKDNISNKVKNERFNAIMELQRNISYNNNLKFINKEIKVLIDRKENDFWIGRSMYDSPEIDNEVLLKCKNQLNLVGKFVKAKITSVENYDLFGIII
jgi:ribosomal protein S12 methylthiotransferase